MQGTWGAGAVTAGEGREGTWGGARGKLSAVVATACAAGQPKARQGAARALSCTARHKEELGGSGQAGTHGPSELLSTLNHNHLQKRTAPAPLLSLQIPASSKPETCREEDSRRCYIVTSRLCRITTGVMARGGEECFHHPHGAFREMSAGPRGQGLCVSFIFSIPVLRSEEHAGKVDYSYSCVMPALVRLQNGELVTSLGRGSSGTRSAAASFPQLEHSPPQRGDQLAFSRPLESHTQVPLC